MNSPTALRIASLGIALHALANRIYYSQNSNVGNDFIGMMNLDSTGGSVFQLRQSSFEEPHEVGANPILEEVNLNSPPLSGEILTPNPDLFGPPLNESLGFSLWSSAPNGTNNRFARDAVLQKLYVANDVGTSGLYSIQRLKLDGSDFTMVAPDRPNAAVIRDRANS